MTRLAKPEKKRAKAQRTGGMYANQTIKAIGRTLLICFTSERQIGADVTLFRKAKWKPSNLV